MPPKDYQLAFEKKGRTPPRKSSAITNRDKLKKRYTDRARPDITHRFLTKVTDVLKQSRLYCQRSSRRTRTGK